MQAPLRVVSAGAGFFAQFHLAAWERLQAEGLVTHIALADPDSAKRDAARRRFGIGKDFAEVAAMLDATRPDLLDIATPPDTHEQLVRLAAERGVACICQKPLASTCAQALAIADIGEAAGIPLVVHENFRWMPWFREMKRWIDEGNLGVAHSVSVRMRPGDGQGPSAYLDRQPYFQKMQRFLVHETLVHYIDAYRFLFGEVRQVSAQLRRVNECIAGEDAGYVSLAFDNGATAMIDASRANDHVAANPRLTMGEQWLEGSAGVLRLDGDGKLFWKPHQQDEREHPYAWSNRDFGGDCVYAQQKHIVAALRASSVPANTARAYLRNTAIVEAVYQSSAERRVVDV
jgi:predicted dehydrogenase